MSNVMERLSGLSSSRRQERKKADERARQKELIAIEVIRVNHRVKEITDLVLERGGATSHELPDGRWLDVRVQNAKGLKTFDEISANGELSDQLVIQIEGKGPNEFSIWTHQGIPDQTLMNIGVYAGFRPTPRLEHRLDLIQSQGYLRQVIDFYDDNALQPTLDALRGSNPTPPSSPS